MTGKASPAKAAEGDEPVFAYIASLPQPQRGVAERIDALAAKTLPDLQRAVKWGMAYYGVGGGWCFSSGAFVGHVKLMFIRGTEIKPEPPVTPVGMGKSTRGVELASVDDLDERQVASWMKQAAAFIFVAHQPAFGRTAAAGWPVASVSSEGRRGPPRVRAALLVAPILGRRGDVQAVQSGAAEGCRTCTAGPHAHASQQGAIVPVVVDASAPVDGHPDVTFGIDGQRPARRCVGPRRRASSLLIRPLSPWKSKARDHPRAAVGQVPWCRRPGLQPGTRSRSSAPQASGRSVHVDRAGTGRRHRLDGRRPGCRPTGDPGDRRPRRSAACPPARPGRARVATRSAPGR